MARAADQFRQSDVVKWGVAAAATAFLALVCANVSALVPAGSFAALHNSRALNQQSAALNAEVAALNGSKSNLLSLAAAQQELQRADAQLSGRLDDVEKAAVSDRGRIGAVEAALPRLVNTLPINGADSSLITGSIGASTAGFKAAESEPPPLTAAPAAAVPAAAPGVSALAPEPAIAPVVSPTANLSSAPAPGPPWSSIISLPVFSTPAAPLPTSDVASIAPVAPAAIDAPFPMSPRASATRQAATPPIALAPVAPPPAHPDVRAIGVAVGSPMQPSAALANWQQIAERVGVKLVGMSPLLADDPAGSPGKVLVAGPVASIAAATQLCAAIDQSGLSCTPMPYVGSELAPAATP